MRLLFVSAALLAFTAAANAEVICTNRGCYETGMKIFRNGGVYRGLPHTYQRDDNPQRKGKTVRIIRDTW